MGLRLSSHKLVSTISGRSIAHHLCFFPNFIQLISFIFYTYAVTFRGAQLDTLVRLAGSTSSAIGLSTTQKVTDSSPPNHNIAKEKAEKMPTITSTHEHESVSTSSDSSLKQKTRSGKFNLFGPLKKETGNNRAEAGRLKGSLFVENVDSS